MGKEREEIVCPACNDARSRQSRVRRKTVAAADLEAAIKIGSLWAELGVNWGIPTLFGLDPNFNGHLEYGQHHPPRLAIL